MTSPGYTESEIVCMPIMKHIRMTMRLGLLVGLDAMSLACSTVVH